MKKLTIMLLALPMLGQAQTKPTQYLGNKNNIIEVRGLAITDSGIQNASGVSALWQSDTAVKVATQYYVSTHSAPVDTVNHIATKKNLSDSTAALRAAITGSVAGVASIAGNTGAFTLGYGLTNSSNVLVADTTKLANAAFADTVNSNQLMLNWIGSSGNKAYIAGKNGTQIIVNIPAGYLFTGNVPSAFSSLGGLATPAVIDTLSSQYALILDYSVPGNVTWVKHSPATQANIKGVNGKRVAFVINGYSGISSAIPVVQSQLAASTAFAKVNLNIMPAALQILGVNTSTNAVTLSLGGLIYMNPVSGYNNISSGGTYTINNLANLWLDMTTGSITSTYASTDTLVPFITNNAGTLTSHYAAVQQAINNCPVQQTHYLILPDSAGFIPYGAYDTAYSTAAARLANSVSAYNIVWLHFRGKFFDTAYAYGLNLAPYINVDGGNPAQDTFFCYGTTDTSSQYKYDVIHCSTHDVTVKNATLIAKNCKYDIHATSFGANCHFENLICKHMGGTGGFIWNVGIDFYPAPALPANCDISFINCKLYDEGLLGHNTFGPLGYRKSYLYRAKMYLDNVSMYQYDIQDYMQYTQDSIIFRNCNIRYATIPYVPVLWNGSQGVVDSPKYYTLYGMPKPLTVVDDGGNIFGRWEYTYDVRDTFLAVNKHPRIFNGYDEMYYNNTAGAISQGYAVTEVADTSVSGTSYPNPVTYSYASNDIAWNNINVWSGTGKVIGVAEENIAPYSRGAVQKSGRPLAYFLYSSTPTSVGTPLSINSSGQWVVWTSGTVYGYARQAASASGLIEIEYAK